MEDKNAWRCSARGRVEGQRVRQGRESESRMLNSTKPFDGNAHGLIAIVCPPPPPPLHFVQEAKFECTINLDKVNGPARHNNKDVGGRDFPRRPLRSERDSGVQVARTLRLQINCRLLEGPVNSRTRP
jgi:hypothetical protein